MTADGPMDVVPMHCIIRLLCEHHCHRPTTPQNSPIWADTALKNTKKQAPRALAHVGSWCLEPDTEGGGGGGGFSGLHNDVIDMQLTVAVSLPKAPERFFGSPWPGVNTPCVFSPPAPLSGKRPCLVSGGGGGRGNLHLPFSKVS